MVSPAGPAAYDGNLAIVFLNDILVSKAHGGIEVGHEAFKSADIYVRTLLVEYAVALALAFVGAYTTAHGGQVAAGVYDSHGIAQIAH